MTHRTFISTAYVRKAMRDNEFRSYIVYGPLGYGKSAYAIKTLVQVYYYDLIEEKGYKWFRYEYMKSEEGQKHIINTLKNHIFFSPVEFLKHVNYLNEHHIREPLVVFDDAGMWLSALEFYDPLLVALGKYFDSARINFAGVMFTVPSPTGLLKKLRTLPDAISGRVMKPFGSSINKNGKRYRVWIRHVRWYESYLLPDLKKWRLRGGKKLVDVYSCRLPQFIFNWYYKLRRNMTLEATENLQQKLAERYGERFPELFKKES